MFTGVARLLAEVPNQRGLVVLSSVKNCSCRAFLGSALGKNFLTQEFVEINFS